MTTIFSGKFGDDLPNIEAIHKRFQEIQKLGIKIYGIHFHCGSGSSSFSKAIDLARECMKIGREYGHTMKLLDVGGGYPTGIIQENILTALKKTKDDPLGYDVIAEPGRHFSANTCYLLFRVMAKRIKQGKLCYHVNDSYYHSFNCLITDGVTFENQNDQFYGVQTSDLTDINITDQQNVSIFGMTCDGADIIANNIKLPNNIEVGDWLCMGGMGSYTIGPKSKFNGMKCTTKVYKWACKIKEQGQKQSLI
ncbi:unnamed protein product [Paramecium sonneborni]|uniref:Ornithine decarboxylase n=1 Tax=Paramecium sonneborni TaxID=65129 RepID=A0A8S1RQ68_9CILI|nr:unnamed protein product [Paramecium sonneborni]